MFSPLKLDGISAKIGNLKKNIKHLIHEYPFGTMLTSMSLVFFILLYFTIPAYYNYELFDKELNKKIEKDFKISLKNIKNIKYSMLPSPQLIIEDCDVYFLGKKEKFLSLKNVVIKISSKNLYKKEKIELRKIYISKNDLDINFKDIRNYYNHLKSSITKPILIKNSNLFFRNKNEEIILISKINKIDYFIDFQNIQKKLLITGKLFGSNFKFNWNKDYSDPVKTFSSIKFNNPNLNIENKFHKKSDKTKSKSKISFLKNNFNFYYDIYKDNIDFYSPKNIINFPNNSLTTGNVKLEPFFFDLKVILSGIKMDKILNNLFLYLYNNNQSSPENFNGNLNISLNELKHRLFENLNIKLMFSNKKISLEDTSLKLKKIGKINFSNPIFYEKDQKLFVNSTIKLDVVNQAELYKRFQIPKKNRIDLKKIYLEIEYNFEDGKYYISNLSLKKKAKESKEFYEVKNIQQLNYVISREFKNINLD
tara:strand:- start:3366 stop:4802 length:1437 start_codon:yes stop_codon:yes gene_type:complete